MNTNCIYYCTIVTIPGRLSGVFMGVGMDGVMVHGGGEVRCSEIGLITVLFLCTKMLNGPRVTPTIRLETILVLMGVS